MNNLKTQLHSINYTHTTFFFVKMSESLSSNDKMDEPEQIDELEDLKTKFVTITPDQMKSIENRKLSTQYGTGP